jgi:hypothetical protein
MWARIGERRAACRVLVGKPEGRGPLGRPRRRWEDNIKMIFERLDRGAQTGSMLLKIGTGGGLLWIRRWTFGFHKLLGISWIADVLASQEALCSMQLVIWLKHPQRLKNSATYSSYFLTLKIGLRTKRAFQILVVFETMSAF